MFGDPSDNRIRVKICGITNESDALAAIECGADALGFNLFPQSPRYIDLAKEQDWLTHLPSETCKVAIMVNPTAEEAARVAGLPFVDLLQLHGNESPQFCFRLAESGVRFAKAIHVASEMDLRDFVPFGTSLFVLDSMSGEKFGGTGQVFPWSLATQFLKANPGFRVILAGGLDPENVAQAIAEARPFGVDVTTGVERSKGRKDHARMREFVQAVRLFRP